MNDFKTFPPQRTKKQDREYKVLLGLVDFYLKSGKAVGSNILKEAGFADLSSATIRNYFMHLEAEGYLIQQHTSGGRIPTDRAYRAYANEYRDSISLSPQDEKILRDLRLVETREIAAFLQHAAETLSSLTETAIFLSAPRFDHDYISELKIVPIDHQRCLCVVLTDFGMIRTEILPIPSKLSALAAKRMEAYFHWRLTGLNKPEHLDHEEEVMAQKIYNELIVRYVVNYSNFIDPELYRTGFSRLLSYSDFQEPTELANCLALFENAHQMRLLIKECCKLNRLQFWIGSDLAKFTSAPLNCSVVAIPYYINQKIAGAVGLLGPLRVPYKELFGILQGFANSVSEALTRNLYKFKITFRQPHQKTVAIETHEWQQPRLMLLE